MNCRLRIGPLLLVVSLSCLLTQHCRGQGFGSFDEFVEILTDDTAASLVFRHTARNNTQRIDGHLSGMRFRMSNANGNRVPFEIANTAVGQALVLKGKGVGIGTGNVQAALHVFGGSDGELPFPDARARIEHQSRSAQVRNLLELVNSGGSRIVFEDSALNESWAFQTNNAGNFLINRLGSGGNEFSIRKNGMVTMGPGGVKNFTLHPNGDLDILGTLSQLSDRNAKQGFQSVDAQGVLEKLIELPITTWNYKGNSDQVRHMGPMAQDFRSAFGLGKDDRSIASVDTTGVTIAAIQALHEQVREKDSRIEENESQIRQLDAELSGLQNRLNSLEATLVNQQ